MSQDKDTTFWNPAPTPPVATKPAPIILQPKKAVTVNSSTQTVGLYYPSDRELQRKRQEDEEREALAKQMRDRQPLLTSISPGKGELDSLYASCVLMLFLRF